MRSVQQFACVQGLAGLNWTCMPSRGGSQAHQVVQEGGCWALTRLMPVSNQALQGGAYAGHIALNLLH